MQAVSTEKLNELLGKLVEQIKDSIQRGCKLPWDEPFFIGYLSALVNAQDKVDFNKNPCPDGRPYSGMVNPLFLLYGAESARQRRENKKMDHRFIRSSSLFAKSEQYKVCKGASVLKGAKAIPVFVPIRFKKMDEETGKEIMIFSGKFSMGYVYNVADTNLVEIGYLPPISETETRDNPPIEILEKAVCDYPQKWIEAECVPHYNLNSKEIHTPGLQNAKGQIAYYSTRCHELAHQLQDMTGSIKGRLDRESYSYNELEAEMTAAYVLGQLGFVNEESDEFKNSASYIQGWLEKIENDPEMLLKAAQGAQRLGNLILKGMLPVNIENREKFSFLPREAKTETEVETEEVA